MEGLWYAIIASMLSIYVILDGFDFGSGILHLFIARTDTERRQVLSAIGPYWSGNEVWLISAGGLLVYVFPRVYAAGFSGFYLPLMMVLWLLILRGISIEFRSQQENLLWRTFWDNGFFASSLCMSVVLGAALGNVIRGVPLGANGFFDGALFTDFQPGPHCGVLDWYTLSVGLFAMLVLAGHGALFLSWKTTDAPAARARIAARIIWPLILAFGILVTYLTYVVQPAIYNSLMAHPWTWILAILVGLGLVLVFWFLSRQHELPAFLSSTLFILSLLAATAAGMYPNMLISTLNPAFNLTAHNAAAGAAGLALGLMWWVPAMALVVLYFANLFRVFSGKSSPDSYGH